ncbi:hypothetical protein NL676_035073 [Syzygium grande]|nr:hypothetical protein NL676_035073 [Syzygium grande]
MGPNGKPGGVHGGSQGDSRPPYQNREAGRAGPVTEKGLPRLGRAWGRDDGGRRRNTEAARRTGRPLRPGWNGGHGRRERGKLVDGAEGDAWGRDTAVQGQ